jgi:predicted DsbA family dithiol-disulfide isomerase
MNIVPASASSGDTPAPLVVEIWADVVCPWCYIGEKRLLAALQNVQSRSRLDVHLRWRPFQLQPQLPAEGLPWRAFAEQKFGGWNQALSAFAQVSQAGQADGIAFDFARVATAPNTSDAHRLLLLAEERERLIETAESFYRGYFAEGANLNDFDQLTDLAVRAGLHQTDVQTALAENIGQIEVAQSQNKAAQMGITGVPFTIFNGRYAIPGAASVEAFEQAIEAAVKEGLWA